LSEVVEAGVETFQQTAAAQGVAIRRDVDPEIELLLERSRIERVVMNLVGNAIEAMPGGGEIVIRSIQSGSPNGDVELEVADNSPGIPPELRSQLFQPFATYGKKNGSGLGLALSRQAVLDHGGDVWAVDKQPPGAVFRIRLPRQPANAI